MESEYYPILFLGKLTDTIIIDHLLHFYPVPPPPPEWFPIEELQNKTQEDFSYDNTEYQKLFKEYQKEVAAHPLTKYLFKNGSIQILGSIYADSLVEVKVDTSFIISKLSNGRFFEAYPIVISNLDKDTLFIGYQRHLRIVVEAKDSIGEWRKITDYIAIHGLPLPDSHMLTPRLSVISSTFKTSGNFKTKLRVKVGKRLSNEWTGNINYNQFNSMFDEKGNYKTEYLEQKQKDDDM